MIPFWQRCLNAARHPQPIGEAAGNAAKINVVCLPTANLPAQPRSRSVAFAVLVACWNLGSLFKCSGANSSPRIRFLSPADSKSKRWRHFPARSKTAFLRTGGGGPPTPSRIPRLGPGVTLPVPLGPSKASMPRPCAKRTTPRTTVVGPSDEQAWISSRR